MHSIYEALSKATFGWVAERYIKNFEPLKPHLKGARINVLLKTWVSMIFFSSVLSFLVSLAVVVWIGWFFDIYFLIHIIMIGFVPPLTAMFTFLTFYLYPMQRASGRASKISNNLPFAMNWRRPDRHFMGY